MNNISLVLTVILLAILTEYLVNLIKPLFTYKGAYPVPILIAMVIGVGLSLLTKADILTALDLEPINNIASYIVTGLVVSGGSSAIHELLAKLRGSRNDI